MKLKTTLAILTAVAGLTATAARAQTAYEWAGSADVRYVTSYVFRGDKKAGQSVQGNLEFSPVEGQNGFYVGAWCNQPFASERNFEFDLYGGYEYHWQGFQLDAGVIGYFYPQSSGPETSYSYEFNVSATRQIIQNWSATVTLYWDIRLQSFTPELSTGYRVPYSIERFPASLDFSAFIGNSDPHNLYPDANARKAQDGWMYYGATISTSVWFTKNFRASIGIQYGDTVNKAYTPAALGGYGKDTSDNLYGYASVGLRW